MYTLKYTGNGPGTFDEPCYYEIAHFKDGIAQVRHLASRERLIRLGGYVDITDQVQEASPVPQEDEVINDEDSGTWRKSHVPDPVPG